MKTTKVLSLLCAGALAVATLSSCYSVNSVTHTSDRCELGSNVGEASSYLLFHLIGIGGPRATLKDACENGNVVTINHVETTLKDWGWILQKKTTRVYGDGPLSETKKPKTNTSVSAQVGTAPNSSKILAFAESICKTQITFAQHRYDKVFKAQCENTKKYPTPSAIEDLMATSYLIARCGIDASVAASVEKKLKQGKEIEDKIALLIEYAKYEGY